MARKSRTKTITRKLAVNFVSPKEAMLRHVLESDGEIGRGDLREFASHYPDLPVGITWTDGSNRRLTKARFVERILFSAARKGVAPSAVYIPCYAYDVLAKKLGIVTK